MSLHKILLVPAPVLRKKAAIVVKFDEDLQKLAQDMLDTMYDAPGIGLAAPQIGISQRIIVMDCAKGLEETPTPMILINPLVTAQSLGTNIHEEGCLSIPDIYEEVTRPESVEVNFQTLDGTTHQQWFDGLWATCVQHEIDHLDGKLFIDYLSPMKRKMILSKAEKQQRRNEENS